MISYEQPAMGSRSTIFTRYKEYVGQDFVPKKIFRQKWKYRRKEKDTENKHQQQKCSAAARMERGVLPRVFNSQVVAFFVRVNRFVLSPVILETRGGSP